MSKISTSGFRRLKLYKAAPPAAHVMAWAGLSGEEVLGNSGSIPPPPERVSTGLHCLSELGKSELWINSRSLRHRTDETVAHILALDRESTDRAVVSAVRAYATAEEFAEAFADRMRDIKRAREIASTIDRSLKILKGQEVDLWKRGLENSAWLSKGKISDGLEVLARWRWEDDEVSSERNESISEGLARLDLMAEQLRAVGNLRSEQGCSSGQGRYEELPRLFLVLRFAEIFTLSTGQVSPMYVYAGEKENRGSQWWDFLDAAFNILNFPNSADGLQGTFRKIAGADDFPWMLKTLAEKSANGLRPPSTNHVVYGELPTVGLLADYKVPLENAGA